jgi:hypothetical protein
VAECLVLKLIGQTLIPYLAGAFMSKVKELIKPNGEADHLTISIDSYVKVAYRSAQFVATVISRLPVELTQTELS